MTSGDVLEHEDPYYILAGSAPPDGRTLVLKHDETFGIFNFFGDIDQRANIAQGLFSEGMRYLSRLEVRIEGRRLLLLSSKVTRDNARVIVDLTNPDILRDGEVMLPRGTLHLSRSQFIWCNTCFERLTLSNFELKAVRVNLTIVFESDFADIFELRGTERTRRGMMLDPEIGEDSVVLSYAGLDEVTRRACIHCAPRPERITESEVRFQTALEPRGLAHFDFVVRCEPVTSVSTASFDENAARLRAQTDQEERDYCQLVSSSDKLNRWVERSLSDIRTLVTHTAHGPYPYAGIPWFSTPFGRDGIITALQLLWVNPELARGVLSYLAATQATEIDDERDSAPGKILHERRTDEMASIGDVPFGEYYGSVDSTPLFIVLAGAFLQHTGDLAFIEKIWPNITAALKWIDDYGDVDHDGFVEYERSTKNGLINQGWKDSHDSIFHANGELAEGPIALCEVQGYVYDAKIKAAEMARLLGHSELAEALSAQANELCEKFNQTFWRDDLGMYALALDGEKRPCDVRSSNAGHALFSGIANENHAWHMRGTLLSSGMFSGWGVRTIAASEFRYNPMSYHNGSIWPHDNAMIAAGFGHYGLRDAALRILRGWLSASAFLDLHRLPELCCGFKRQRGNGPTLYPVACSPQAWAAGAVFMMLGACLGMRIDGARRRVILHQPRLPKSIRALSIRGLRIGHSNIDMQLHQDRRDVGVFVSRKQGEVEVIVTK